MPRAVRASSDDDHGRPATDPERRTPGQRRAAALADVLFFEGFPFAVAFRRVQGSHGGSEDGFEAPLWRTYLEKGRILVRVKRRAQAREARVRRRAET